MHSMAMFPRYEREKERNLSFNFKTLPYLYLDMENVNKLLSFLSVNFVAKKENDLSQVDCM